MIHFNVSMQHTEETFEKLAHMQYDLFCRSNLIARSVIGIGVVILGIANFSSWWGVLLIAYGSFLASGKYNAANHTAHKLAKQIRASEMPFPASRYVFRDQSVEVIPLPENKDGDFLSYKEIYRLGEDREYFYLFRDQYGGYMIPKEELGEKETAFRKFMEKKSGQTFQSRSAPIVKMMRRMRSKG